jgi:ABC-type Fe3+/spermidine/putrescine transport system ATPase subunit
VATIESVLRPAERRGGTSSRADAHREIRALQRRLAIATVYVTHDQEEV